MPIDVAKVVELYHQGLNQQEIADKLGFTRSYISLILIRELGSYERPLTIVTIPNLDLTDEELVSRGYKRNAVAQTRLLRGERRHPIINRARRRTRLAVFLFGKGAFPGPKFNSFLEGLLPKLSARRAELIKIFYLEGKEAAPGISTELTYRHSARLLLKDLVNEMGDRDWESEGVIIRAKS